MVSSADIEPTTFDVVANCSDDKENSVKVNQLMCSIMPKDMKRDVPDEAESEHAGSPRKIKWTPKRNVRVSSIHEDKYFSQVSCKIHAKYPGLWHPTSGLVFCFLNLWKDGFIVPNYMQSIGKIAIQASSSYDGVFGDARSIDALLLECLRLYPHPLPYPTVVGRQESDVQPQREDRCLSSDEKLKRAILATRNAVLRDFDPYFLYVLDEIKKLCSDHVESIGWLLIRFWSLWDVDKLARVPDFELQIQSICEEGAERFQDQLGEKEEIAARLKKWLELDPTCIPRLQVLATAEIQNILEQVASVASGAATNLEHATNSKQSGERYCNAGTIGFHEGEDECSLNPPNRSTRSHGLRSIPAKADAVILADRKLPPTSPQNAHPSSMPACDGTTTRSSDTERMEHVQPTGGTVYSGATQTRRAGDPRSEDYFSGGSSSEGYDPRSDNSEDSEENSLTGVGLLDSEDDEVLEAKEDEDQDDGFVLADVPTENVVVMQGDDLKPASDDISGPRATLAEVNMGKEPESGLDDQIEDGWDKV